MQKTWKWYVVDDLSMLSEDDARGLTQDTEHSTPFLSIAFLTLLSTSGSVDGKSGWQSHHIAIRDDKNTLIALVPCYLKTHSYGEYVFDHAWANAYHQHSLSYYPKLVCAIPFTPVTGARALVNQNVEVQEFDVLSYVSQHKDDIISASNASSLHILFLNGQNSNALHKLGLHQRLSVQFVWFNQDYKTFDDFLDKLTSRKRRSIRKERAPFTSTALQIRCLTQDTLNQHVIDDFYLCYQQTYFKRSGHAGYLTANFFANLLSTMAEHICIIAAFRDEKMIAGSLFFYNDNALFGRYWGALEDVSGLHFECCYYQGIEFAISRGIALFNPGTQGEHKILRGFRPTFCYSNHYMYESAFDDAVADFLSREQKGIEQYHQQASQVLPYKHEDDAQTNL
ncbi:GNAT family N-acetyltransferase [Glaciecola sp. XM2]|uniref:GNAT family N-acetyltransferase n=1 Tax=Glaciecola sp. XM2 TaxID=1914931 RepID=UPI001BDE1095|nr:peptidogalycan biosysnthesis protein [Glaciecola sp. XM2]MBT1450854.1 GNAT family N-acetyltransferase [Glaciecola sp. XM2]